MPDKNTPKKSKFDTVMDRLDTFMKRFERSKFAEVTTTDDSVLSYEGELEVGTQMYITVEEEEVPLPEGSYELAGDMEGTTVTVDADGKVTEIVEPSGEEGGDGEGTEGEGTEQAMSKDERQAKAGKEIFETTIRVVNKWDLSVSADSIEVGTELIEIWDGEEWGRIADGEYELEDGTKIQVNAEGVVVLMTPPGGGSEGGDDNVTNEEMSRQLKEQEEKLTNKFNSDNSELVQLVKDMGEQLKTFGEQASVPPVKKKFERTESKDDGMTPKQRAIMSQTKKG